MSLKILLINSPRTHYKGSKEVRVGLPLGIMYIAAVLEKNNYQPKILDCLIHPETIITSDAEKAVHGIPEDKILYTIKQEKPDIVGITCLFTTQIDNAMKIADLAKQVDKKIITVIGGPHSSIRGKQLLEKNKNLDIAVKGEGEYAFLEIVMNLENNGALDCVKNIFYRDKSGQINQTEIGSYITDLDNLPYPSYHLIDMEFYFNLLEQGLMTRPSKQKRSISFISSRGCPFNCIFCSVHLHMGRLWRAHSAEYVVNHVEFVADRYKVKHISFEDDNFTLDLDRTKKILHGIIDRNIKITWDTPNGIRADRLDKSSVRLMKKSGCIELIFGVESGDQEVLDRVIDKKLDLDSVIQTAAICKKIKIKSKAFFMIGIPGEKLKNIRKTIDFVLMLKKKYKVIPSINIATPLIGTRMYDICKKNNYLIKEPNSRSLSLATLIRGSGLIKTEDFSPDQLKELSLELAKRLARIDQLDKFKNPITYLRILRPLLRRLLRSISKMVKTANGIK